MAATNQSYWENELYNQKFDLIVVGGGLTGQSTALFYKRSNPDAKVLVLDRGFYPLGASTRNAGFACFGSVTEHIADMELEEEANIIDRIRQRYSGLKLLRETLGDENIDYREPGAFEIFTDEEAYQNARSYLDLTNWWLQEATGLKDVYASTTVNSYPAISIKGEGCLHPGKMMKTLHDQNLRLGVEFRWQSKVKHIHIEDGAMELEGGPIMNASQIVVATNAFTSELLPHIKIKPGRGYVFVTKPIPRLSWQGTFHYDRGYYYFRNVGDNRLLLGGARSLNIDVETTTDFGTNEIIKNHLVEFAGRVLRLPNGWEIDTEWSGIMGFTDSKSPLLERLSGRCLVTAGLSGMGVALGMQLGKEAGENIELVKNSEY